MEMLAKDPSARPTARKVLAELTAIDETIQLKKPSAE